MASKNEGGWGSFIRLVGYARPWWHVLLAAVLCTGIYSGARVGRAFLARPIFDVFLSSSDVAKVDPGDLAKGLISGVLGSPSSEAQPSASPAERAEARQALGRIEQEWHQFFWALIAIIVALPVSHFGQEYFSQYLLGRMLMQMQRDLAAKLLAVPLSYHQRTSRGDTLSRTLNDTSRAHQALDQFFVDVVQSILTLAVCVLALVAISWQLTLAVSVAAPPLAGVIGYFGRRIRRHSRRRQESQAGVTQRLLQILAGIKIVKAFSAEEGEARAFAKHNYRFFRRNMRVMLARSGSRAAVEALNQVIGIGVLLVGLYAVMVGWWGLTKGTLATFVLVMLQAYRPMRDFSRAWTRLQESTTSADRFFSVIDAAEEPPDAQGAVALPAVRNGIRLRDVTFSYGREPVLREVSLDVRVGEMVAIVGKTGSGKTTLADLLLRLYDPQSGAIEVDGIDLRRLKRRSWLEHVAVVTQDPFLFAGTIRENILYGRPSASEEEMLAAAQAAHVNEFAERLRDGYDTDVGEAGSALSGGQRQRITIARAILKKPDVLIFDEATSALDAESERLVQDAIDALLIGRTTFVIAHRLSTVRHADKILVLSHGRAIEVGTHDDLMSKGGAYADLMGAQEFAA